MTRNIFKRVDIYFLLYKVSLFRAIIFHTTARTLFPLRKFRSFWWIATYSRRNWVTRKMCRVISLAFILNGKHSDEFLIREIFLHILKLFLYIFVYSRISSTDWRWMKRSWDCCIIIIFFVLLISLCISQLSALLTYAPIEFRSFLFHLRDFSLSSAYRDVVLSQEWRNIIEKYRYRDNSIF